MSQWIVDLIQKGDRIQLLQMTDDPQPIPPGTMGTVQAVVPLHFHGEKQTQVLVKWDNGRSLSCICPPDVFSLIPTEKPASGEVVSPVV
jgi:hypothetical protein